MAYTVQIYIEKADMQSPYAYENISFFMVAVQMGYFIIYITACSLYGNHALFLW